MELNKEKQSQKKNASYEANGYEIGFKYSW